MNLEDYIKKYFAGSQVDFANFAGKTKQAVNRQLKTGKYIVVDNAVYFKSYDLPKSYSPLRKA